MFRRISGEFGELCVEVVEGGGDGFASGANLYIPQCGKVGPEFSHLATLRSELRSLVTMTVWPRCGPPVLRPLPLDAPSASPPPDVTSRAWRLSAPLTRFSPTAVALGSLARQMAAGTGSHSHVRTQSGYYDVHYALSPSPPSASSPSAPSPVSHDPRQHGPLGQHALFPAHHRALTWTDRTCRCWLLSSSSPGHR